LDQLEDVVGVGALDLHGPPVDALDVVPRHRQGLGQGLRFERGLGPLPQHPALDDSATPDHDSHCRSFPSRGTSPAPGELLVTSRYRMACVRPLLETRPSIGKGIPTLKPKPNTPCAVTLPLWQMSGSAGG